MMTQQTPDPVQLYRGAVANTRSILSGVREDQFSGPTPCVEWDVRTLVDHVVEGTVGSAGLFSGGAYQPTEGSPAERFGAAADRILEEASKPGTLEQQFDTPFGTMPGGEFLVGAFMDVLIHGWDIAKATGQQATLPDALTQACHAMFEPNMGGLRHSGAFGTEVGVPAGSDATAQLVGMFGRQP